MATSIERERKPTPTTPEGIKERAETFPKQVEKGGVKATPTQFKAQVHDDQGKPLIQTPATKTVTIQLPADEANLVQWAKSPVDSSIRWLAAFWLRVVKKAKHFGWRIIRRSTKTTQGSNPQT